MSGLTKAIVSDTALLDDPHPRSHLLQHLERSGELVLSMRGGHDGAEARFAFGDSGKRNAGREDTFIEQLAAELHGQTPFANDDRGNRRLAGRRGDTANIEPEQPQLLLEEARIRPQLVHALRFLLEYVKRRNAGCSH